MSSSDISSLDSRPVIVLGAGGHAAVVISSLKRLGVKILGITDEERRKGEQVLDIQVLGTDREILAYDADDIKLVNGITAWRKFRETMRQAGYQFRGIIDPTVTTSPELKLAEGVQIMAGAIVQPRAVIGRDTIINTGARIDHDCRIGDDCHICPGVILAGGVVVESGTMIGAGTVVIPRITIGQSSVIAAGSVIFKNVRAHSKVIQRCRNSG